MDTLTNFYVTVTVSEFGDDEVDLLLDIYLLADHFCA